MPDETQPPTGAAAARPSAVARGGARGAGSRVAAWAAHSARSLARLWRTSLQFRVVVTTMLLGLLVMVLLQTFLYQRTSAGLVQGRVASAREDAAYRAREMQAQLDATDQVDAESIRQFTYDLVRQQQSQTPDQAREVILQRALRNTQGPQRVPTMWTAPGVDASVVPEALRQALADDPSHQQIQTVVLRRAGESVSAVIVGQLVTVPEAGLQELYFVFPLDREEAIMSMILRTFVLGSLVLVVLIGLVAYVVTRLVVDPVREAAEVAGRLSSGRLNERMHVKGEDDLAKLASSFNGMADNLQAQISQLEDLSRVQQRFVSDVSHELRTPLTTIRMASEVIHDARADFAAPVARSTELLYSEVDRFEALLSELLEISRFDAGGAILDARRVDVREVVDRAVTTCRTLAAVKGSEVVVVGDPVPPSEMDPRRVERILRNLLVNALEHGEGRPVTVQVASNEAAVGIVVQDEGVGLEAGQAALVFNRFWRADPSRNRTTGGTGLGLAISLEDAHLHHGWLQAWGSPGRGARFRLTLPLVQGEPIVESPLPLAPPVPIGTSAEDDPDGGQTADGGSATGESHAPPAGVVGDASAAGTGGGASDEPGPGSEGGAP